jgi:hypothetical protein
VTEEERALIVLAGEREVICVCGEKFVLNLGHFKRCRNCQEATWAVHETGDIERMFVSDNWFEDSPYKHLWEKGNIKNILLR